MNCQGGNHLNQSIKTHFYSAICRERIRGLCMADIGCRCAQALAYSLCWILAVCDAQLCWGGICHLQHWV